MYFSIYIECFFINIAGEFVKIKSIQELFVENLVVSFIYVIINEATVEIVE